MMMMVMMMMMMRKRKSKRKRKRRMGTIPFSSQLGSVSIWFRVAPSGRMEADYLQRGPATLALLGGKALMMLGILRIRP
jgi:hypothetical protein